MRTLQEYGVGRNMLNIDIVMRKKRTGKSYESFTGMCFKFWEMFKTKFYRMNVVLQTWP